MERQKNIKTEHMFLDELNSMSQSYKVKVRVVEKARPRVSPKKGILYQTLVLADEKGNKMRGALFGEQVEGFKEAIAYNGEYEIANAPIKPLEEQWRNDDELPYQMSFSHQTIVQPLSAGAEPVVPQYQPIASIPRAINQGDKYEFQPIASIPCIVTPDVRYDVLGVVLFVEEEARSVVTTQGRENVVREIVITDQTNEQPLIISAWNDLAKSDCDKLNVWAEKFIVVGFTALRPTYHKGFSLATGMSTEIIHDPKGDKANVLKEWAKLYSQKLLDRQARILQVRYPTKDQSIITIEELKQKKACNALQDERHWITVIIPNPDLDKINTYIGCSNCGKRTNLPIGIHYPCSSCNKKDAISSYRVTFKFDAVDSTGTISLTTFNDDTEKLFKKTAAEIYSIKESEDIEAFEVIQNILRTRPFSVKLGPTTALSRNNILQWTLKAVEVEGEAPKTAEDKEELLNPFNDEGCSEQKAVPDNVHESDSAQKAEQEYVKGDFLSTGKEEAAQTSSKSAFTTSEKETAVILFHKKADSSTKTVDIDQEELIPNLAEHSQSSSKDNESKEEQGFVKSNVLSSRNDESAQISSKIAFTSSEQDMAMILYDKKADSSNKTDETDQEQIMPEWTRLSRKRSSSRDKATPIIKQEKENPVELSQVKSAPRKKLRIGLSKNAESNEEKNTVALQNKGQASVVNPTATIPAAKEPNKKDSPIGFGDEA